MKASLIIKTGYFSIVFVFIIFLSSSLAGNQNNQFDSNTNLFENNYTKNEIETIEQGFKANPLKYSSEFGRLMLWQIYNKNNILGLQIARLPDLNNKIDPKESEALKVFYDYIKDINFPADLPRKQIEAKILSTSPQMFYYHVLIKWSSENKSSIGSIMIFDKSNRLSLKEVIPKNFEESDKIIFISVPLNSYRNNAIIKIASSTSRKDEDCIEIKFTASKSHKLKIDPFGMLGDKQEIVYLSSISINKPKSSTIKKYSRADILYDIAYGGLENKDLRYNSYMEALFWLIKDGRFNQSSFEENYDGSLSLVKKVWGDMKGARWKDFNTVGKRLNTFELFDYWVDNVIRFSGPNYGPTKFTKQTFKDLAGDCSDVLNLGKKFLSMAGENIIKICTNSHVMGYVHKNGLYWMVIDFTPAGNKLRGPFNNYPDLIYPYNLVVCGPNS